MTSKSKTIRLNLFNILTDRLEDLIFLEPVQIGPKIPNLIHLGLLSQLLGVRIVNLGVVIGQHLGHFEVLFVIIACVQPSQLL